MKTEFWLMAGVMIIIGLLIVIPPLWRKREAEESDVDQQNIDIARQKFKDLKSQLANGAIDQAQYEAQFTELEQALSDDLSLSRNLVAPQKQGRWIVGLLFVAIPVVAVSLYQALGNPNALFMTKAHQTAARPSAEQQFDSVEGMVSGLAERLKNQPDDLQGWVMLGKSYKYLKQFKKAADALAKANVLAGSDPDVMLEYADALVMVNGGNFAGEPRRLIFKALELAPNNVTGLWLAGMINAQEGEYAAAMAHWRQLESMLEPGSKSYHQLKTLMAKVQTQNNGTVAKTVTSNTQQSGDSGLQVKVGLSAELQNQTAADDTVFIYAKAMSGPQMPLAIVRKKVSDLPVIVRLTDAQAMTPMMKLSKFQQVKLTARISKTGNAMQQPGDMIGVIDGVNVAGQEVININIDRIIN